MRYIDVSEHQGVVDWEKVKGNVDGVMIRAGYGQRTKDEQFARNVEYCNVLGIPCGAYWFSYAYTPEMARNEARALLNAVKPYRMELPLAFDYEYDSVIYGKKCGASITDALVKSLTNAFCSVIEGEDYYCMIYANPDFINKYFGNLANRYDLWLAQWTKTVDVTKPPRKCGIWQWGGSTVPGITGNVDTNEAYKDYPALLREIGCNHLASPSPAAAPSPAGGGTGDVPWYAEAMEWAKENGIMDGTRPTDAATRAEVAQMFFNLMHKEADNGR